MFFFIFYRFEYPEELDVQELDGDADSVYCLYSVLVHSGNTHGGHYYHYMNPKMNGEVRSSKI